jgi:hypothetical protein
VLHGGCPTITSCICYVAELSKPASPSPGTAHYVCSWCFWDILVGAVPHTPCQLLGVSLPFGPGRGLVSVSILLWLCLVLDGLRNRKSLVDD